MSIIYKGFNQKIDNPALMKEVLRLHTATFGDSNDLQGRMEEKTKLRVDLAIDGTQVVGYKIGYALSREQFYSWLGGVDTQHQGQGIATKLMEQQHLYAKENSYKTIETRTKNKWRGMLLLNIKNGFDVIGTLTDSQGEPKIILEKKLI